MVSKRVPNGMKWNPGTIGKPPECWNFLMHPDGRSRIPLRFFLATFVLLNFPGFISIAARQFLR